MKSLDITLDNIQQNNFLIIGRAGIDIYPDPPGTKTENAKQFVTYLGGSSANIAVSLTKLLHHLHPTSQEPGIDGRENPCVVSDAMPLFS